MILIRHGQSEFNVRFAETRVDPMIRDPHLTALGRQQIADGAARIKAGFGDRLTRIVTSPYTRTLQSAAILAEHLDLPVEIDATVGEYAKFTCDVGSPRRELEAQWPHLDFADLAEEWWPYDEEDHHVDARARTFRQRMAIDAKWPETLVVSHWGFIRALTGHPVLNAAILKLDPTAAHPHGADLVSQPDL